MTVPSLLELCILAAAGSRHWTVQRRSLERLPDHAANDLLAQLLARQSQLYPQPQPPPQPQAQVATPRSQARKPSRSQGQAQWQPALLQGGGGGGSGGGSGVAAGLRPATLELFRHCVTRVALRGPAVTADWLAVLAGFGHLQDLQLLGCSKVTSAALRALLTASGAGWGSGSGWGSGWGSGSGATSPPQLSASSPFPASTSTSASTSAAAAPTATNSDPWRAEKPTATAVPATSSPLSIAVPRTPPGVASAAAAAAIPLSAASGSLQHLDLSGCSRLDDDCLALLSRLPNLKALNISETGVRGPGLAALSSLTGLTQLQAGGLKSAGDAAWCAALHSLTALQHLDLWGSDVGSGAGGGLDGGWGGGSTSPGHKGDQLLVLLAFLLQLRRLNLAWTPLETLPAFPGLQVLDMRHCRLREVWWPAGEVTPLALRQLLLRGATVCGPAAAPSLGPSATGLAKFIWHCAPTLELLDLGEVAGATDPWVAPLAALADGGGGAQALTHLDLSRTNVRPEDLELLQAAPALQRLSLAGTRAGGPTGAAALLAAGLPHLQELDLSSCGVVDGSIPLLQQLTALTHINLSNNPDLTLATPPLPTVRQQPQPQQPPQHQDPQHHQDQQQPQGLVDVWAPGVELAPVAGGGAGQQPWPRRGGGAADARPEAGGAGPAVAVVPVLLWPQLRRLNLLGSRVGEEGLRALLRSRGAGAGGGAGGGADGSDGVGGGLGKGGDGSGGAEGGGGGGGGEDGPSGSVRARGTSTSSRGCDGTSTSSRGREGSGSGETGPDGCGKEGSGAADGDLLLSPPLPALEQLKLGGPGVTDGAVAVLAAARLPRLHSLLLRDATLTGYGALQLAAGCPALRRLELQSCWLVSEQDAARLAAACRPYALVAVNGKAPAAAAALVATGTAAGGAVVAVGSSGTRAAMGRAAVMAAAAGARDAAPAGSRTLGVGTGRPVVGFRDSGRAVYDALAPYDQRLRYSRDELLRLASSPFVVEHEPCDGSDPGGGASECAGAARKLEAAVSVLVGLPAELRRRQLCRMGAVLPSMDLP